MVVMPLMPCFKGDVCAADSEAEPIKAILHFQYSSICREQQPEYNATCFFTCIYKRLKENGIKKPSDYIHFGSLRKCTFQDNTWRTEIVYVHSKLMIVDDKYTIIGSANINDRSQMGDRDSEVCM